MKPGTELPWSDLFSEVIYPQGGNDTDPQDAAYIVHACNAYPKLVAALKAIDWFWTEGGDRPQALSPHAWITDTDEQTIADTVHQLLAECEEE